MDALEIELVGVGMTCVSTVIASVDMAWKLHRNKDRGITVAISKTSDNFSYEDDEKANSTSIAVKVKKIIPKIRRSNI